MKKYLCDFCGKEDENVTDRYSAVINNNNETFSISVHWQNMNAGITHRVDVCYECAQGTISSMKIGKWTKTGNVTEYVYP